MARLFLGNLHFGTTEDDVHQWFLERSWVVTDISIVTEKNTGQSRGFGFAECDDPNVITDMNGQKLHGRKIVVNAAKPREDRNPRDGGVKSYGKY